MSVELSPVDRLKQSAAIRNPLVRNLLSEFFGTFMLLFIGLTIVMQFILTHEKLNTWININMGWGFAITFCVMMTSQTSGGHLNPAVSFLMVTLGKLSVPHFFLYSIVQTAGAFIGAFLSYLVYYDQFQKFSGDRRVLVGALGSAGCFCSFPGTHVSNLTAFFDQVAGTGLLCLFLCVIVDKRNKIPDMLHPICFGLLLIMIGCSMGMNLGYPINPARDLGPRLFAYFIYGKEVFTYHNNYFWIPVVAPFFGAVLGGWSYHLFVGIHIEDPDIDEERPVQRMIEDGEKSDRAEHKRLIKGDNH
ncbi:unnamed protein product, partial [Mesorhabditis belari]|uniref:Aquaporin n=1 Tax=Mesorhabditis belari TaxID=2138241 RepID=A0AAF3FJ36_9BILA